MGLFLEILSGPMAGDQIRIVENRTIGRSESDYVIIDEEISSKHAVFEINEKNHFILNDLGSTNGLLIQGRKVKKVVLLPGVRFTVGRTDFVVREVYEDVIPRQEKVTDPYVLLAEKFLSVRGENERRPPLVSSMSPTVSLQFTQGLQTNTTYFIGFGPRICGYNHWDLELKDPYAPEECFKIIPGPGLAQIQNLAPEQVLINGKKFDLIELNDDDIISIGVNKLRVKYVITYD